MYAPYCVQCKKEFKNSGSLATHRYKFHKTSSQKGGEIAFNHKPHYTKGEQVILEDLDRDNGTWDTASTNDGKDKWGGQPLPMEKIQRLLKIRSRSGCSE